MEYGKINDDRAEETGAKAGRADQAVSSDVARGVGRVGKESAGRIIRLSPPSSPRGKAKGRTQRVGAGASRREFAVA